MNKKKFLKLIGFIFLIIILFFIIYVLRNFIIIKNMQNKFSNYENSTNYSELITTTNEDSSVVLYSYYLKNSNEVILIEKITDNEIVKISMYTTDEKSITYTESGDTKIVDIDDSSTVFIELYNLLETDNIWQTILSSITTTIKSETYNGSDCYVISRICELSKYIIKR